MLTDDVIGTLGTKCLVTAKEGCSAKKDLRLPFGGKVCCKRLQTAPRQWLGIWVTEMTPYTKLILVRLSV